VLDGYDEYNDKSVSIFNDIIDITKYPNTKIIMTCRENYAQYSDYITCFGINNFEMSWICPFDDGQRNEYISRFVKTVQGLKKYYMDFDSFESVEEYEGYFKKYSELLGLSKAPFTLRIIMNILPLLVK
jgi:hypothetical protein